MADFPSMPLWVDAYLGDTTHLTTIEHGAYLLLIMTMWRSKDGTLPNDDKMLARYTKLTTAQWKRIKPIILDFFTEKDGVLFQSRLTAERSFVEQKRKQQSSAGKASALKRKENGSTGVNSNVDDPLQHNGNEASTPTPTPIKEKYIKEKNDPSERNEFVKKTKITQSFCPDQESAEYAASLNLNVDEEQRKFINHFSADGQLRHDWQFAFRAWCDKAAEFAANRKSSSGKQSEKQLTGDERYRSLMIIFQKKGYWPKSAGPEPGKAGCYVPADVLREFGFEPIEVRCS